tara:strand:- start:2697 stop:2912 length:216 start_codon:yes stop_codon:yes gene_type:complete
LLSGRTLNIKIGDSKMSKMKDFVDDFLHIVNNEEKDTYYHKEWSWDNLPHIEVMFEVINRHDKKNNRGENQ